MDSYRNGGGQTPQLEPCHDLSAQKGERGLTVYAARNASPRGTCSENPLQH